MPWTRDEMAARAAQELEDGMYVNLGIGIPALVANHVPAGKTVSFHSENGILSMGPYPIEGFEDADLINASKQTVTVNDGASFFDSAQSFGIVRGGHLDVTVLGAMEVAANGDLASWMIPGKLVKGMGGAMDMASGAKRVIVLTEHTNKHGQSKVLNECTFPLTAKNCASLIITPLGVFRPCKEGEEYGLRVIELSPDVTMEEVKEKTEAKIFGKTKYAACVAVLNPDKSHVLLGQRSSTAPIFAKKWTLPGGHLDHVDAESPLILSDSLQSIFQNIVPKPSGLTLQQALNAGLRELKEETGYDLTSDVQAISTAKLLGWAEIDGRAGDKIVTFYFSLIGETQRELNIVSHEYSQLQWLDRAAILENDLAPKSKGACIRALSHPNQHNEHEI